MGLIGKLEDKIGARIQQAVERLLGPAGCVELLEIYRGILNEVEARVEPVPGGKRAFPFNHLLIQVAAPQGERRAVFELVFGSSAQLEEDIRGRLERAGCGSHAGPRVHVLLVEPAALAGREMPFEIEFRRLDTTLPPGARLNVLRGKAEPSPFEISQTRVNIGRLRDVFDDRQRLVRRNDLAFLECEEPANRTVSREHAHIDFDEAGRCFRLFDDGSACGTRVVRQGRAIPVPARAQRGQRLMAGDLMYFGQACVGLEIGA